MSLLDGPDCPVLPARRSHSPHSPKKANKHRSTSRTKITKNHPAFGKNRSRSLSSRRHGHRSSSKVNRQKNDKKRPKQLKAGVRGKQPAKRLGTTKKLGKNYRAPNAKNRNGKKKPQVKARLTKNKPRIIKRKAGSAPRAH
ncbi:uncharacterized protein LOC129588164 [Paramacrobiotus metropolitanus]|uniref:uncharacterized protein LOC129588164 n=1 Tax=Paramacrobiotus metropolitanus TaxID=2943436 RepID=UPI0024463313|nr:uncharacterized protein LOC129588164 [Paramacrobiotus metropolitanus]